MKRWPIRKLGDLVDFVGGGTPRRDRADYWGGDIPWASVKDLQGQSLDTTLESITATGLASSASNLIPEGTVIIASRVGLGKVAINSRPVAINQDLKALTPRGGLLLPRYLLQFLLSNAEFLERSGVGATVKGLTIADYQKLAIALPPLAEQSRIVKLLDESNELRKLRAQADHRTSSLLPALFHEMFGDPIEGNGRWPVVSLKEIASQERYSIVDGPFGASLKQADYRNSGVPVIRIKNISAQGHFVDRNFLYISEEKHEELRRSAVKKGDILVSRVGTLGNTCIYPGTYKKALLSTTGVCKITVDEKKVDRAFLHALFLTPRFQQQIVASSSSAVQPYFNLTALRGWKLILPPLPLQLGFARQVTAVREMEAGQLASRERLEALCQSMLHRAFIGEL